MHFAPCLAGAFDLVWHGTLEVPVHFSGTLPPGRLIPQA